MLRDLPAETICYIAEYLYLDQLLVLMTVSKRFYFVLGKYKKMAHLLKNNQVYSNENLLKDVYNRFLYSRMVLTVNKNTEYTQLINALGKKVLKFEDMEGFQRNYFSLKHVTGIENVLVYLISKGIDPGCNNNFAVQWAAVNGHSKVLKLLLKDSRVNPSVNENYCIRYAAYNGHLKCVQLLLNDLRVDPAAADNFAIRFASSEGHHEIVQLLLTDQRVNPSVHHNFALKRAYANCHHQVVNMLLQDARVDGNVVLEL
jgi:hypothetical protein